MGFYLIQVAITNRNLKYFKGCQVQGS